MKIITGILIIISAAVLQGQTLTVSVGNPSARIRQSETITLNLQGLYQSYPEFCGKNVTVDESGKQIVHQLIDENFDGVPDILIFQSSFKPKEKKKFSLLVSAGLDKEYSALVDGRFVLPRQDFAWENDRIAFRVYGSSLAGDVKNGTDVWNKRVRYPIIKKWYAGEEEVPKRSYHQDHGEGADYFSVGKSLGCGSAGVMWKGSLVQSGLFSFYRVITNGPVRVSFELYYPKMMLDSIEVMEIKRVTLDAGSNLNKIEEQFVSNIPLNDLTAAVGLVKRKNIVVSQNPKQNWMTVWGLTTADSAVGYLGTAVVMNGEYPCAASEDTLHWLLSASLGKTSALTYYTGAGWTLSRDYKNETEWKSYIESFAASIDEPLLITVSKK